MKHVRISADLEGIGGRFEKSPDNFFVEELPLYLPQGEGEHLYVTFEKVGWNTRAVVKRASEIFSVPEREVGYAGLKDRHATTVQTISIPRTSPLEVGKLQADGIRVLEARLHGNKLRTGHLAGNRFRVIVRDTQADPSALLARLESAGLPNFYGDQRFGEGHNNVAHGLRVLRKGPRAAGSKWKARFLLSALQSELFNHYLTTRMIEGAFSTVLVGDVLQKVDSGGIFVSEEPETDQPRFDAFEVSITGPIFGAAMRSAAPETVPAGWEAAALESLELTLDAFARSKKLAPGTRRKLRARVTDTGWERRGDDLELRFTLPPGTYATVLIDELIGATTEE